MPAIPDSLRKRCKHFENLRRECAQKRHELHELQHKLDIERHQILSVVEQLGLSRDQMLGEHLGAVYEASPETHPAWVPLADSSNSQLTAHLLRLFHGATDRDAHVCFPPDRQDLLAAQFGVSTGEVQAAIEHVGELKDPDKWTYRLRHDFRR